MTVVEELLKNMQDASGIPKEGHILSGEDIKASWKRGQKH
jgi:hypothetical protein